MLDKTKNVQKYVTDIFSDVRSISLTVFVVVALLVTWSGIKVVQTNYDLQKQISVMRQENDVKKLANSNLALKNQYLETDQYLELVARRQFNKALPGEKLLIIPQAVAMAHTIELPKVESEEVAQVEDEGPFYERNFNAWLDFLFRD